MRVRKHRAGMVYWLRSSGSAAASHMLGRGARPQSLLRGLTLAGGSARSQTQARLLSSRAWGGGRLHEARARPAAPSTVLESYRVPALLRAQIRRNSLEKVGRGTKRSWHKEKKKHRLYQRRTKNKSFLNNSHMKRMHRIIISCLPSSILQRFFSLFETSERNSFELRLPTL